MPRVEQKQKPSSTGHSISNVISSLFEAPTWVPEFPNVRIVGNGSILPLPAISIEQNVLNAIVLTNSNITVI